MSRVRKKAVWSSNIVEGANSGIGLAAAGVIASSSDKYHVIVASRNIDNAKKAVEEIKTSFAVKGDISTIRLDVNDDESIRKAAAEVEQQYGHLDVLVNNAGVAGQDVNREQITHILTTNSIGPILVSEAFKPLLLKARNPYSVYISSGLGSFGLRANPGPWYNTPYDVYSMSKSALNMWALQESKWMKKEGLKVFIVCPGLVVSNLRGKSEEQRQAGGNAGSPVVSGETILNIIEGKRDADVGKFVHKDGVYPW